MNMMDDDLYVVQYLRAATSSVGRRLPAEKPRIYRVAAFSGDTVWGINVDTQVLTKVNREAGDRSGRAMNMQALTNLAMARRVAERIAEEIDAEQAEEDARVAAAAETRRAAQQAKRPAPQPEPEEESEEADGATRIEVSYTIKPAKPAGKGDEEE